MKNSSVDNVGVSFPMGMAVVFQESTIPVWLVMRSEWPFLRSRRSIRLSLPFIPLLGVALFMAVSREEDQTHDRGIDFVRSLMISSSALMLGAWIPLYRTILLVVLGSLFWRAFSTGFSTVEESFHRCVMASSGSLWACLPGPHFADSQYFLNFHFWPVYNVARIGPSPMVAIQRAVAP